MFMFSADARLVSLCLALVALVAGCPSAHPCAKSEACNGRDDDCDGRSDEDFIDGRGRYVEDEHCGSCVTSCSEVFPSALETRCDTTPEVPVCELVSCPRGTHVVGRGACVPDEPVLCLPCTADDDCSGRTPRARCVTVAEEQRCGTPCSVDRDCPTPFRCDRSAGQCRPDPALCACQGEDSSTFEVACLAQGRAPGLFCAGVAMCGPTGLGNCEIASAEICDGEDDDCDGLVDEDFVDGLGRYVGSLHCGGCGKPCVAPGPNYEASCNAVGSTVSCSVACATGFVDVDGIRANGCECERFDGTSAPVAVGGDTDCDGVVDDNDAFVHVTTGGSDSAPGTLIAPMRSIDAAIARALAERKSVLIAQGSYEPFTVAGGVSVFGGYRADFRTRDPELFPVIVGGRGRDGAPVLSCKDVRGAAVIDGITLRGADATTPGRGSTAARFDGCGPEVKLAQVTLIAGRGADGRRGDDASARLPPGIGSLTELAGSDAQPGLNGDTPGVACTMQAGGSGGSKSCGETDVSGGSGGASGCPETGCRNGAPCGNAGCTDFTVEGVCDYPAVLASATPNPPAFGGRGPQPGGPGAQTYNSPTNRGICNFCDDNPTLPRLGQDGNDGARGAGGAAGPGCVLPALSFDENGRASAASGGEALAGGHGSGGGGGSGGSGYDVIAGTVGVCDDTAGGSGGGGGSGGCGAPGGGGGTGGGASLGMLVRLTAEGTGPVFERVRIVTASGGKGGDGGIGAAGGRGGVGALGGNSRYFCARNGGRGGNGGAGGSGGGGGGGCGGPSHAVLVEGALAEAYRASATAGLTIERTGVPGQGGRGGFSPGESGVAGLAGGAEAIR